MVLFSVVRPLSGMWVADNPQAPFIEIQTYGAPIIQLCNRCVTPFII